MLTRNIAIGASIALLSPLANLASRSAASVVVRPATRVASAVARSVGSGYTTGATCLVRLELSGRGYKMPLRLWLILIRPLAPVRAAWSPAILLTGLVYEIASRHINYIIFINHILISACNYYCHYYIILVSFRIILINTFPINHIERSLRFSLRSPLSTVADRYCNNTC